jgi:hypothetical protein
VACQHGWYAGDQGPVNPLYSLTLNRAEAQRSLVLHDLDMDIVMPMERSRPVLPGTKPYRRSRAISSPASRRQDVPVLPPGGRDAPARSAASVRCRGGAALAKALVDRTHSGGHLIRESRRSVSPPNPRASQSDLLAVLFPIRAIRRSESGPACTLVVPPLAPTIYGPVATSARPRPTA